MERHSLWRKLRTDPSSLSSPVSKEVSPHKQAICMLTC